MSCRGSSMASHSECYPTTDEIIRAQKNNQHTTIAMIEWGLVEINLNT